MVVPRIDEEFKSLIPPLSADEFAQLEANIIEDGCREPLIVWADYGISLRYCDDPFCKHSRIPLEDGEGNECPQCGGYVPYNGPENILIDGHNRLAICEKHGIEYEVTEYDFDDRDEALLWIINNQLGRRNLQPVDKVPLVEKRRPILERMAREREQAGVSNPTQNSSEGAGEVRQQLAKEVGVSHPTYDALVTVVTDGAPELIDAVRKKTVGASTAAVVAELPREEQAEIVARGRDEILRAAKAIRKEALDKKRDALSDATRAEMDVAPCGPPSVTCADALEWIDAQEKADLIITDPPYMTDVDDIESFAASWLPKVLAKMHSTGHAYVFIGAYPREISAYTSVSMPHQILVWTYRNTIGPQPADRYKQNWQAILYYRGPDAEPLNCDRLTELFSVQDVNAPDGRLGDRYHAWQKPMEIAERFVRHSTRPGDIVLDPFCCTGTFLLAASKLGRSARGCDISDEHLQIAVERGCVYE